MTEKIQKDFNREDFAKYLQELAEQFRVGKIISDKKGWTVPDEFGAKIQLKEKKGRIELKLNCRWSTLADYTDKDREKIDDWRDSMKSVKKRMGSSFKEITSAAAAGEFPASSYVENLVETSRIFLTAADPEWKEEIKDYMDHLENFVRAVESRQLEVMLHEVRDLQYRMKSCHKEYK